MENATKALLMAGGILVAIIIISLAVAMFTNTGNVSKSYSETVSMEEVTIFNSNFAKYEGKKLTVHDVVTICNFALNNSTYKLSAANISGSMTVSDINEITMGKTYNLKILGYDDTGFVKKIQIIEQP